MLLPGTGLHGHGPSAPPLRLTSARVGIYAFLVMTALFFLMPLYVMIVTSLKTMGEIRLGAILELPRAPTFEPWIRAWSSACTSAVSW